MVGMIGGKRVFFNQSDEDLVRKLILKKYLKKKKEELIHLKAVLKKTVSFESNYLGLAEKYLEDNPVRAQMLADEFAVEDYSLRKWADVPDRCEAPFQEYRTVNTVVGIKVRSKSESMIVSTCYENRIPFRYEEPLRLGSKIYYPDFTIRDPKTGEFYWYEHFGKMDEPEYVRHNMLKLSDYAAHGIVGGVNLAITYETKDHQLDFLQIRHALSGLLSGYLL